MDLEAVVVLLADRDAAGLQHAPRAGGEAEQAGDVVLVFHRARLTARGPHVPGGGPGRAGTLGEEDGGVGDERADLAHEIAGQVDAVRGQIAQHPAAAPFALVTPGQGALRMGGIVAEQADADVGDGADLPRADQLAGGGDGRCVAVVEAHRPLHPGPGRRLGHGPRVGGGEADRLLDPDVLARLRHGGADLAVQEVRRGDGHRPHPRVGCQLPPVAARRGEAVPRGGLLRPPGRLVGDGHQLRPHLELGEMVRHPEVRLGVHPPHPAKPDNGNAEGMRHDRPVLDRPPTAQTVPGEEPAD